MYPDMRDVRRYEKIVRRISQWWCRYFHLGSVADAHPMIGQYLMCLQCGRIIER